MAHWQSMPDIAIYNMSCEQLVTEHKAQLNALFSFLNCQFEPQCLQFYTRKSAVTTLSKQAIRQPVNTSAVAHWQRYKTPLLKLLDETP